MKSVVRKPLLVAVLRTEPKASRKKVHTLPLSFTPALEIHHGAHSLGVLDPLEMELPTAVSRHVGTGN